MEIKKVKSKCPTIANRFIQKLIHDDDGRTVVSLVVLL